MIGKFINNKSLLFMYNTMAVHTSSDKKITGGKI